jgi:two-component system NtrC family sensor kinase
VRTLLGIPLLREGLPIGVFVLARLSVRPFTQKQIELVTTFADQAVIAIENTRLLTELRESLEQQTATSEVLRVISSSPGDLRPVFDAILANATRLSEATFGVLALYESEAFRVVAMHNPPRKYAELRQREPVIRPNPLMRMAVAKQVLHIADATDTPFYKQRDPDFVRFVELGGVRTKTAAQVVQHLSLGARQLG